MKYKDIFSLLVFSARDFLGILAGLHIVILVYLFFLENDVKYLNIFYILDLEKVLKTEATLGFSATITSLLFIIVFFFRSRIRIRR